MIVVPVFEAAYNDKDQTVLSVDRLHHGFFDVAFGIDDLCNVLRPAHTP